MLACLVPVPPTCQGSANMREAVSLSPRDATLDYYRQHAPGYRFDGTGSHHRHLDPFLDRLKPRARILELGCGTGNDAARMGKRGFMVDATDGTPAMVRKAKERFGIEARVMRFDELDTVAKYDAVWAHACLLHVPLAELPPILSAIRRALRSGGFRSQYPHRASPRRRPAPRWTTARRSRTGAAFP